jgi:hypothetical protein
MRTPAQHCAVLKILTVEKVRARQSRCVDGHRVPKRNSIQPMQFDGCYRIAFDEANDSGAREQLNLLLCRFGINAWFPRRRRTCPRETCQGKRRRNSELLTS